MRPLIISATGILAIVAATLFLGAGAVELKTNYAERKGLQGSQSSARVIDQSMPVDAAYRAIPHARTPFQSNQTRMPAVQAEYLDALFALTDAGVVERVVVQRKLGAGKHWTPDNSNYTAILQSITSLDTPEQLIPVEGLIFEAIQEQQQYLKGWRDSGSPRYFRSGAPLVQSSHRKLITAYQQLMRIYGAEGSHNRQAFFDHLCALDFI